MPYSAYSVERCGFGDQPSSCRNAERKHSTSSTGGMLFVCEMELGVGGLAQSSSAAVLEMLMRLTSSSKLE
jgi:hypothetical protein